MLQHVYQELIHIHTLTLICIHTLTLICIHTLTLICIHTLAVRRVRMMLHAPHLRMQHVYQELIHIHTLTLICFHTLEVRRVRMMLHAPPSTYAAACVLGVDVYSHIWHKTLQV